MFVWNTESLKSFTAVDIDECEQFGGGCVDPAICVNLPGSFECQCPEVPDDYELIDGVICERWAFQLFSRVFFDFVFGEYLLRVRWIVRDCCALRSIMNFLYYFSDECADPDQGGCSHNCTNTVGGYMCFCPGDLSLVDDGLTCGKIL